MQFWLNKHVFTNEWNKIKLYVIETNLYHSIQEMKDLSELRLYLAFAFDFFDTTAPALIQR